ncbi:uncharacterized protein LOC135499171 [Lineus longissimus]|uniref:uncharacterized protein LOC135499171 n=1 Tax=Lineus longissimus TaxID=88925 RepID=UPI00315D100F
MSHLNQWSCQLVYKWYCKKVIIESFNHELSIHGLHGWIAINPFSEPSKWKEVLQNFNFYFTGEGQEKKDATERGIVDRFAVLLTKFKKDELTSVRVKLSRRRKQVKTYLILVIIRGRLHLKDLVPNHDLASDFNFIEVEDQEVIPELKHHYKTRSGPELPVDDFLPDLGGDVDAPDSEVSTRASSRQESSIPTATTSGQTSRSRRQASSLFTDTNSSTMDLAASTPAGGEVVPEMRDFAGGPDIEMDDTVVIAEQHHPRTATENIRVIQDMEYMESMIVDGEKIRCKSMIISYYPSIPKMLYQLLLSERCGIVNEEGSFKSGIGLIFSMVTNQKIVSKELQAN